MIQLFASIKLRLLAIFILLGLIPSLILFSLSYNIFSNYIKQNTKNNILEKNMRIKDQIESFYSERLGNIAILSGTELLANAFEDFDTSLNSNTNIDNYLKNKRYEKQHLKHHHFFLKYLITYGYYDIIFINTHGRVIYTVKKESDFLSELKAIDSSLAKNWGKASEKKALHISNIEKYHISDNHPFQFISMPIFKNNKMLGSIFFQISYENIFQLLKENKGHSDYENLILKSDNSIMIQSQNGFVDTAIQYSKLENLISLNDSGYHEDSGNSHQKPFIAYSKIKINSDLNWILITEYSTSILNSTFLSLQKTFFIIIIIVFITIVALSFLLRKKIVDPLILEKERVDLYQMNIYSENLRTLGVLASGMAHELNNPLTIIEGSLTLMNKHIKEPNLNASFIQNKLDMATKACNRMSKIIRHMLDLSRDSRSEEKLNMSLNAVINGTLYFYEEKFRHKGIKVNLDLDPQLPKTNLYPTKIETVILNLLSNSFDSLTESFMDESRKKEIHIKTYVKNSLIYFQLIDTGGGISPEIIKNIFVPFFTTKVVGKGTGLGLSIAHEFIQLHKGQIEITSQLNESTTVLFWLPIE